MSKKERKGDRVFAVETEETSRRRPSADIAETGRIYCANCIHCKLVATPADDSPGRFHLRIRCDAGKWKKKLGGEKMYKYFTVTRRNIVCCDSYESMGEDGAFISDLRNSLPIRDELYD